MFWKKTKIVLEKDDCALVLKSDGEVNLFIAKKKDHENVTENVVMLSVLSFMLEDEESLEFIDKKRDEFLELLDEDQVKSKII